MKRLPGRKREVALREVRGRHCLYVELSDNVDQILTRKGQLDFEAFKNQVVEVFGKYGGLHVENAGQGRCCIAECKRYMFIDYRMPKDARHVLEDFHFNRSSPRMAAILELIGNDAKMGYARRNKQKRGSKRGRRNPTNPHPEAITGE